MQEGQLEIDWELAKKRNEVLDEERRVRDKDRREEKRLAHEWRAEEARRYEASQKQLAEDRKVQDDARRDQERDARLFQAAMMSMLGVQEPIPRCNQA
ncbi:uncharacterized protein PGTG_21804 [Puccinia graminis f. sp. tritici CRL 75-36-700-3]|uniref:Uncharacterized protein n=2 Tax=Puccinia graminis f. sp. tritici TaxID=56615 RepID=H6QSJ0_PUCGT|nr:uncharacterized protein PGTG_21804 [Puccinia graminis f. sp. tritici CRL 75-36-700-3]EHS63728.1 hypothetical protein PGTG_21804 [Puccinia graminis f. sp. tritici CRL 75-36-700-3]